MRTKGMLFGILTLLVIVVLVLPVLAGSNDQIEECSTLQLKQIANAIKESDFGTDYDNLVDQMDSIKASGYSALLQDVSQVQENWWADIVPLLPDCAFANRFIMAGGRMLDELTISAGLGLGVVNELAAERESVGNKLLLRAQYHISQWTDSQDEFLAIINELSAEVQGS